MPSGVVPPTWRRSESTERRDRQDQLLHENSYLVLRSSPKMSRMNAMLCSLRAEHGRCVLRPYGSTTRSERLLELPLEKHRDRSGRPRTRPVNAYSHSPGIAYDGFVISPTVFGIAHGQTRRHPVQNRC